MVAAAWVVGLSLSPSVEGGDAPRVRLDGGVQRPRAAVLLITVDGLAPRKLDEYLADGDLPNIRRLLIDRGVRVRRAVASQPTITYANLVTLLTGRHPGHHGILGNKWFDRYALVYRDYTTMRTYRYVDDDFAAPTVFERVNPAPGVSIQCAVRRGAARKIDNWASSGIRWFFGRLEDVDQLVPLRLELVADAANRWGRWPPIIHAYLPALDEIGHRKGCDSPEYRRAAVNVDRQIGRLHEAVRAAGTLERTFFILVSDHGHLPVPPDRYLDVADFLRRRSGMTVADRPTPGGSFERRSHRHADIDAVVVVGGDRRAAIHLRGPKGWSDRPDFAQVEALLGQPGCDDGLLSHPAVKLALAPRRDGEAPTVEVYSRRGRSRLTRRCIDGVEQYGYEIVTTDALAGAITTGWHDAEAWLAMTVDSSLPDFVVQMVELFDSPRAGDLMLVARPGWDFLRGNRGGHGGADADEVLIPMIFAGPGIPAGGTIDHARLVDVAPTILGLLGEEHRPPDPATFDGIDRSAELREAKGKRNPQ